MPNKSKVLPVIIGVIVLLAIGGGAFALMNTGYFNGGNPTSLAQAGEAFKKIKYFHFDSTTDIEVAVKPGLFGQLDGGQQMASTTPMLSRLNLDIKGDLDNRAVDNPRGNLTMKASLNSSGIAMTYEAEVRVLSEKDVYVKLISFPGAGFLPTFPTNQWIHVPIDDTKKSYTDELNGLDGFFENTEFINITDRSGGPIIEGEPTEKLVFAISPDALLAFFKKVGEAMGDPMTDADVVDAKKALGRAEISGEMFIGRKTQLPYKLTYRIVPNVAELEQYMENLIISGTLTFSKFDEKVDVEVPADAIEADELDAMLKK